VKRILQGPCRGTIGGDKNAPIAKGDRELRTQLALAPEMFLAVENRKNA